MHPEGCEGVPEGVPEGEPSLTASQHPVRAGRASTERLGRGVFWAPFPGDSGHLDSIWRLSCHPERPTSPTAQCRLRAAKGLLFLLAAPFRC
jgi:hypothetical protein